MSTKTFLLRILVPVIITLRVQAQVNEGDTMAFQLRTRLTGNYQQGNVEALTLRASLDFAWAVGKKWVFKSQNNSLYQSFYSKKADQDLYSRNYLYYNPFTRFYPFAIAYISSNYRRKVEQRYFAGAGITFRPVNRPGQVWKLSVNAVYEETRFSTDAFNDVYYNGKKTIRLFRSTLYTGGWFQVLDKKLRIFYDAYWQPSFNRKSNYRMQADTGLEWPIWNGLAFTGQFSFSHEQLVAANIRRTDRILTFGLSYQLIKKHLASSL